MIDVHLQPRQEELYDLLMATGPNIPVIIGAGGGKGCGKSAGARNIALLAAIELGELYPGITITITRRVEGDLIDNHLTPLFKEYPELRQYWSAGDRRLLIPGRGAINFRYAQTTDDVIRKFMGGYESAVNLVEEAQQFSQEELQMIHASSRWTDKSIGIPDNLCKTAFLFNTGGTAASYLRRVFHYKQFEEREDPRQFAFIIWYGWDNYEWFRSWGKLTESQFYKLPSMCEMGSDSLGDGHCCRFHLFVRETTEGRKYNAYPRAIRQGYLLADFNHFEGQYFAGVWDEQKCTVSPALAERMIQPWWKRWMSFDWGFGHHSACYWFAAGKMAPRDALQWLGIDTQDTLEVIVAYRELVVNRTPEFELATRICDMTPLPERREITRWFVDGAIFGEQRNVEKSIADLMMAVTKPEGLPQMERAVKDRVAGWRTLHDAFRRTSALRSGAGDVGPGPVLLVSKDCPAIISAVPVLICDPKRVEDVLKLETMEDDAADGFRYGVESYLRAKSQPPIEVRAQEIYNSAEDMTTRHLRMQAFFHEEQRSAGTHRRYR